MLASRLRPAALTLAAAALALTGCTVAPVDPRPPVVTSTSTPTASATPTPSPTMTPVPATTPEPGADATEPELPTAENISCDTMLDPAIDADLRARGLRPAAKQDPLFGIDYEGAHISCPWGYEGAMTPEEMYTYTQLTADEREQYLAGAAENGYIAEVDAAGTWLIWQSPDGSTSVYDEERGAWLVADEWTVMAPSREAVTDIVWVR